MAQVTSMSVIYESMSQSIYYLKKQEMKRQKPKKQTDSEQLVMAAFLWKNDVPDGLGLRLGAPDFSPEQLTYLFFGETVRKYFKDSDALPARDLADTYFAQLSELSRTRDAGPIPTGSLVIAAWNIMYLADRGFIPNDEFNGPYFAYVRS